jgi:hypothetical protein
MRRDETRHESDEWDGGTGCTSRATLFFGILIALLSEEGATTDRPCQGGATWAVSSTIEMTCIHMIGLWAGSTIFIFCVEIRDC